MQGGGFYDYLNSDFTDCNIFAGISFQADRGFAESGVVAVFPFAAWNISGVPWNYLLLYHHFDSCGNRSF